MGHSEFSLSSADGGCDFRCENDSHEIYVAIGSEFMSVDLTEISSGQKVNISVDPETLSVCVNGEEVYYALDGKRYHRVKHEEK